MSRKAVGAVGGLVAAVIAISATSGGILDLQARWVLGIVALAAVFWALEVLNAGITALFAIALLLASGLSPGSAFTGFASSAFWILVSVLFFGRAMDKTGLAKRISYRLLILGGLSYRGILFSFFLIGFVLALGIPSMTVRTAIMVPVAWALVQSLGLRLPSRGSALIVLSTFEMAVLPGCALLTGSLWGPFISGLFTTADLSITWLEYARMMALPTMLWCGLVLTGNALALRPEQNTSATRDSVRRELEQLGSLQSAELKTALIVATSVAAWASQAWHGLPAEAVGLFALTALFATNVLIPDDIATGIPWGLTLFIGGILSVTSVMATVNLNEWLGGFAIPAIKPFLASPILIAVAISAVVVTMRFMDPFGFITIAALFLPLVAVFEDAGFSPLALVGLILLPAHVFWFSYQNIWLAMTDGITKKAAYTDAHRLRLATVFIVVTLIVMWLSLGYWRLLGVA